MFGGCFIDGSCTWDGRCDDLKAKECPEEDGNICTVPSCTPETGECFEEIIVDGHPPYVSTECWEGALCMAGEQDNSQAEPSALALECAALGEGLSPFACLVEFVCVGGREGCLAVNKVDGVPCWTGPGEGDETCVGHSCLEGECIVDHELDVSCGPEDFPADCGGGCETCTGLSCHWIDDPANPTSPTKMVRYCKPQAKIGYACQENPCLLGQECGLGSSGNGPLGKETLGQCTGGVVKSKEQCTQELGKPLLPCILAGMGCEEAGGGCVLSQEIADQWCHPPDWKCFDKTDTYCTHLESGEDWDEETGCNTAWIDLDCDDQNECTVDICKALEEGWECEHQPVTGSACDDGDPCTTGGQCQAGECLDTAPKCSDADENPCNDPACDPVTGDCLPPQTDGYPCNDGSVCTVGDTCQDSVCTSGDAKSCDDQNVCTDDFCDPLAGCLHEPNGKSCDDGDMTTVGDTCESGECVPGAFIDCEDDNVCTDDIADPQVGCKWVPAVGPCDDFDVCTVDDQCAGGECIGGLPLDCGDDEFCTVESCHQVAGCVYEPLPDWTSCPGGLNYACLGGECLCHANCDGKECGSNGCGGTCGECEPGEDCQQGSCGGTGFNASGKYALSQSVFYSCFYGAVSINLSQLTFVDNGAVLVITPAMNGCCTLDGLSAGDGDFSLSCTCSGGGFGCDETYSLTGTFDDDKTWAGTFTIQYSGMLCGDCVPFKSWSVTGTKPP